MAERREVGLATAHWPAEYGGADLSLAHQLVVADEFVRANAPDGHLFSISLNHLPGTLIPFGTEDQKRTHLPRVAAGTVWCQGFSEPAAGSDLAALRTRAERDGDCYVLNGQKVWSSYSMYADWCILLARTRFDGRKQEGITFFLLDMKSPGIEIRPTRQSTGASTGASAFAEVFLSDVRIPVANRVGEENRGWTVAQATLSSERGVLVFEATERQRAKLERFYSQALATNAAWLADDQLRREFMRIFAELQALRRQIRGLLEEAGHGPPTGWSMTPALVKLVSSTLRLRTAELQVRMSGLQGQIVAAEGSQDLGMYDYLDAYGYTISAGTNEIMRNLIAEKGLDLPRG
jgi:alkylation response protein AidB-like acyl-CoA dehydrogenase